MEYIGIWETLVRVIRFREIVIPRLSKLYFENHKGKGTIVENSIINLFEE